MVALRDGVERQVVHPDAWLRSPSPYSYGIQSGNTLFLSGLVSRNGKDNTVVPGDMKTQTQTVLQNAREILAAAGMTLADVVSSRVYITDTALFQDMNAVYRDGFPPVPPARATVRCGLMSTALPRRDHDAGREGPQPEGGVPSDAPLPRPTGTPRQARPPGPQLGHPRRRSPVPVGDAGHRPRPTRATPPPRRARRWRASAAR